MASEEGGTQPVGTVAASEKTQAPKPAATFSSFINKNTTGKKFAPKAARRRPGAGTAPAAKPPIPQPSTEASNNDATQTSHADAESSSLPNVAPVTITQLPTPAPTQEAVAPPRTDPTSSQSDPATAAEQTTANHVESDVVLSSRDGAQVLPSSTVEAETEQAAKRRRVDVGEEGTRPDHASASQPVEAIMHPPHEQEAIIGEEQGVPDTNVGESEVFVHTSAEAHADSSGGPRVTPWTAVNHAEIQEQDVSAAPPAKIRPVPKPRRRKHATVTTEDEPDVEDDSQAPIEARTRGKRKAAAPVEEADGEVAPPKRTRRPRKSKATVTTEDDAAEGELEAQVEDGAEPAVRRLPKKPRQPRRKKQPTQGEEGGVNGEGTTQSKRRGRPPREATPDDAEDKTIDPENTFMDSLASRNIRVGKLSRREQEMRKIDWVAVRQRRREEDARPIETREIREARERLAAEQMRTTETGPQYRLVDGQIQLVPGTTTIDRNADADRERELMEVTEERDLTTRITSRSFLKNNKRFPNEFVLPGQGKRWTVDDTELFYQGLRSFGTDFQMISRMFPGSTRRSIKTKFTREEREHPDDVRDALLGKSELTQNWDMFLKASQMEEEEFVDADEIKRQLAEEEAEMRERIVAAQAETEERKRQQREAGVLDDEEGNEASNKENGKGRKKRKGKEKQVTFQEDDGVEILGGIDDDDSWGKE